MSVEQTQWGPQTAGIVGAGILGFTLAVGAVTLVTDLPGRVLVGLAAVGILIFALMSGRARPKLAIVDGVLEYR
ncbi:MAG: PH domain-containing protein, partial [Fuerstiella sp.]|nr:PH domain-containing protein [Fuerstiella sp.]